MGDLKSGTPTGAGTPSGTAEQRAYYGTPTTPSGTPRIRVLTPEFKTKLREDILKDPSKYITTKNGQLVSEYAYLFPKGYPYTIEGRPVSKTEFESYKAQQAQKIITPTTRTIPKQDVRIDSSLAISKLRGDQFQGTKLYEGLVSPYEYKSYMGEGLFVPKDEKKIEVSPLAKIPFFRDIETIELRKESAFQQEKEKGIMSYLTEVKDIKTEQKLISKEIDLDIIKLKQKYPRWEFKETDQDLSFSLKEEFAPELEFKKRDPLGTFKQAGLEAGTLGIGSLILYKGSKEYLKYYTAGAVIGAGTQLKFGAKGLEFLGKIEKGGAVIGIGGLVISTARDPLGTLAKTPELVGGVSGYIGGRGAATTVLGKLYQPRTASLIESIRYGKKGELLKFESKTKITEYDWLKSSKLSKILPEKIKMRTGEIFAKTEIKRLSQPKEVIVRDILQETQWGKIYGMDKKITIGGDIYRAETTITGKGIKGIFGQDIIKVGKDQFLTIGKGSYVKTDLKGRTLDIVSVKKVSKTFKIGEQPYFKGQEPFFTKGLFKYTGDKGIIAGTKIITETPSDIMGVKVPRGLQKGILDKSWKGLPPTDTLGLTYIPSGEVKTDLGFKKGKGVDRFEGKKGLIFDWMKPITETGLILDIPTPSTPSTLISKGKSFIPTRGVFDTFKISKGKTGLIFPTEDYSFKTRGEFEDPIVIQTPITSLKTSLITKGRELEKEKIILGTDLLTIPKLDIKTETLPIVDFDVGIKQATEQQQKQLFKLATRQKQAYAGFDIPFTPFATTGGIIVAPSLPDTGKIKSLFKIPKQKEVSFKTKYTPSVEAVLLDIKGVTPPKELYETGLILRPLTKKRRRK